MISLSKFSDELAIEIALLGRILWKIRNQHHRSLLFRKLSILYKKLISSKLNSNEIDRELHFILVLVEDNLKRYQLVSLNVIILSVIARIFKCYNNSASLSIADDFGEPVNANAIQKIIESKKDKKQDSVPKKRVNSVLEEKTQTNPTQLSTNNIIAKEKTHLSKKVKKVPKHDEIDEIFKGLLK